MKRERIGFDPDGWFMDEENLNEKIESDSVSFLKYITSIFWIMILFPLAILILGLIMVMLFMKN